MDAPLIGCIFTQILVEDSGRQEGASIVILYLQIPQVCVGLSICTDNYLQDQQGQQIRIVLFSDGKNIKRTEEINNKLHTGKCMKDLFYSPVSDH